MELLWGPAFFMENQPVEGGPPVIKNLALNVLLATNVCERARQILILNDFSHVLELLVFRPKFMTRSRVVPLMKAVLA